MWKFGDVIRVDPEQNPGVPQPDNRRWLILVPASTGRPWLTLFVGPGGALYVSNAIIPWNSMTAFVRVEEDEA